MNRLGVVGCGVVGSALVHLFETNGYKVVKYDKFKPLMNLNATKRKINECDVVFICVPTPFKNGNVDISAVEECVSWIKAPNIVIKSTVPPGTTRMLGEKYKKRVFHNPEFLRADTAKEDIFNEGRVLLGIPYTPKDYPNFEIERPAKEIRDILVKCMNKPEKSVITTSEVTELIKYATNAFLATKVAFCNEMDIIAKQFKRSWNDEIRDFWVLDKRIGDSHTIVTEERGFGGTCLPKDLDGLISFSNSKFFKAVKEQNERTKAYKIPQAEHTED